MANRADSLIKIRDGLIQQVDGLNEIIDSMAPFVNMAKIQWQDAEGSQGKYEKSIDDKDPEYVKLAEELFKHDGKMTLEGFFVWLFSDGKAIGRKRKK